MSICWGVSDQEYVVLLIAHNPSVSCIVQKDIPLHMLADYEIVISPTLVLKLRQGIQPRYIWM